MSPPADDAPLRVLVADDHVVFRRGLGLVLEPETDLVVVGEAADTASAVSAAADLEPDVVLMDLRMPGGGGIEATRQILAVRPATRIIVLTVSDDDADLFEAVRAGAAGYLLKEVSIEEVADAVRTVASGQSLISPAMAAKLMGEFSALSKRAEGHPAPGPAGHLTEREAEALRGIARGLSNRAIAAELGIAENTVKNHVRGVLEKLGVSSRTEAAMLAVREGLVDL
jgi:DNA-binding NarL/FixJ family response regulator